MNKKIRWGVVVILGVVAAYVVWEMNNITGMTVVNNEINEEQAQQMQNEQVSVSNDWKTYVNQKYGFQVDYPSDSNVQEYGTQNGYVFEISTSNNGKLVISTEDTITDSAKRYGPGCGTASGLDPSIKMINGVTFNVIGVSREFSINVNTSATEYCATHNGIGYKIISKIAYGKGNPVDVNKDAVLNAMIASFKFTSKSAQSSTALKPSVTVISPNGGEKFGIGADPLLVTWRGNNLDSNDRIMFALVDSNGIVTNVNAMGTGLDLKATGGSASLITPPDFKIGNYRLRITDDYGNTDFSDNYFHITNQP